MEEGAVPLAGEEESDEEDDEEAVYGDVKVLRPGLGLKVDGAASGAAGLDLSGKGGCGSWDGAAGVKADEAEGIVATLGASGDKEAVTPVLLAPNGRAVVLYAGLEWLVGLVYVVHVEGWVIGTGFMISWGSPWWTHNMHRPTRKKSTHALKSAFQELQNKCSGVYQRHACATQLHLHELCMHNHLRRAPSAHPFLN